MNDADALRIRDLEFAYPFKPALFERLDLETASFPLALLGPNGAGKSTLLSMLATLVRPQSGAIELGHGRTTATRRGRNALRREVGYLPQSPRAFPALRAEEQVAYSGWLKGMSIRAAHAAASEALAMVQLESEAKTRARQLSGGQLRRLGIAQAIVNRPEFLVLDEPYAGLDIEQRAVLREALRTVSGAARVVVSTHQVDDLDELYHGVVVLAAGRVLFAGSPEEFLSVAPDDLGPAMRAEVAYVSHLRRSRE